MVISVVGALPKMNLRLKLENNSQVIEYTYVMIVLALFCRRVKWHSDKKKMKTMSRNGGSVFMRKKGGKLVNI